MPVLEYTKELEEAVSQFNTRLRAAGMQPQFPESHVPEWLPPKEGRRLVQQFFLSLDDAAMVRGGYILKHQDFWIHQRVVSIADMHQPISEGAIDRRFPQVAVQMLRDAQKRQPLLFGLGIGGYEEGIARLFQAARWTMFSIPFYFRMIHPFPFLRNLTYVRRSLAGRVAFDALAFTGLGWLGIHAGQSLVGGFVRPDPGVRRPWHRR